MHLVPAAAPPVSAPASSAQKTISHNDQAVETRGLEGGTKMAKGLDLLSSESHSTSHLMFKGLSGERVVDPLLGAWVHMCSFFFPCQQKRTFSCDRTMKFPPTECCLVKRNDYGPRSRYHNCGVRRIN